MQTKIVWVVVLAAVASALASVQVQGFGGTIAIGMGRANEVKTVAIPFTATVTVETEEHTINEQIYYFVVTAVNAAGTVNSVAPASTRVRYSSGNRRS